MYFLCSEGVLGAVEDADRERHGVCLVMEKFPCHVVSATLMLDASLPGGAPTPASRTVPGGYMGGTQQALRTERLKEWALHKGATGRCWPA